MSSMVDSVTYKLSAVNLNDNNFDSKISAYKLAPSQYGMFISLNCKLYLRRSASRLKTSSKPAESMQANNVSERMKLRGSDWEVRICNDLEAACNLTTKYTDCTNLNFHSVLKTILFSSDGTLVHYLYQATLVICEEGTPAELQKVDASISRIIPDLLKLWRKSVDDPWTLMIIDAKSSLTLKQSHQAQVAFYSYFLAQIFADQIERGLLRMSEIGGVWLQPAQADASVPLQVSLREFHLKPWLQLLQQHLQFDIPQALSGSIEDVPWHLNAHCSSCPYLQDCRADKPYGPDIRALPHVSASDSKLLQSIAAQHAAVVPASSKLRPSHMSVQALHAALVDDSAHTDVTPAMRQRALRAVGGSSSKGETNLGVVTSVLEQRAVVREHLCGTFPANRDEISVFIALCCDPALGLPFAWAINANHSTFHECAQFSTNPIEMKSREQNLLVSFLMKLCEIVESLGGSAAAKGVTVYVWDGMEKFCLTQLVIKALCGELSDLVSAVPGLTTRVHYLALVLLDHPQQWHLDVPPSPELTASATPRVRDVTSQFRALVHLPIAGFYSSTDITAWAAGVRSEVAVEISLEAIEREWARGDNVTNRVVSRVRELSHSTQYLRDIVAESTKRLLFNKSAPLPDRSSIRMHHFAVGDAIVQRLIFMKQVDVLVRCAAARQKRIAALNNPAHQIRLRCVTKDKNSGTFEQVSGPAVFADSAASEFIKKWCLVKDQEQVVVNFADLQYLTEKLYCPDRTVAFVTVKVVSVSVRDGVSVCLLQCTLPSNALVAVGEECVLFAREVDLNVAKSVDSLTQMGGGSLPHTFVDLISDPNRWNALPMTQPPTQPSLVDVACSVLDRSRVQVNTIYQTVIDLSGGHESPHAKVAPLTGVQAQAFHRLVHDKLTIVWGPPGTGKTHFAAKSILNLIEMASRHSTVSHLRVLVCATTHAAIDEILSKFVMLKNLAQAIPNRQDTAAWADCKVFKFKSKPTDVSQVLEGVQYTEGPTVVNKAKFAVLGATTWSLYKKKKSKAGDFGVYEGAFKGHFDVVVIDEASQMPVSDALMPLSCLREGPGGRLLVVGDTLQLPPIFAHKFGPPPRGVPPVQSSVLECLLRTPSNLPVDLAGVIEGRVSAPPRMIKLSDNFRMNATLSRFTSRLYGADYVPSAVSRNRAGKWHVQSGAGLCTLLPDIFRSGRDSLPELVSLRLVPHRRKFSTAVRGTKPLSLSPMTTDEIALTSEHDHLAVEATVVANLIEALAGSQVGMSIDEAAAALFACTPHNNQKAGITRELALRGHPSWSDIADTAERMQGQERDVVVICLGYLSPELVGREVDFLYSKQRLNVAISRAKKSCILIYTDAMVALNPEVIGNIEANEAYEHLLAFIAASEALGAKCDIPVELQF